MQTIAIVISALALSTSLLTAWLTLLRRGLVRMTHPTVVYFGPDPDTTNKIYLRTLLFCTARRGRVVETMYVNLSRNETQQNFAIWVNGEEKLARGSGLYVSENGIVANHHFLPSPDEPVFHFLAGTYRLRIFAKLLDEKQSRKLFEQQLNVSDEQARALMTGATGLYFDWAPESAKYISHLKQMPQGTQNEFIQGVQLAHGLLDRFEQFKAHEGDTTNE